MTFVHLRSHSEFSVVDGTLRIDEMVRAAAADGQPALAITDLANVFGAVKFYSAARHAGIKPIVGADVWLEPEGADKTPSRLLLLVRNARGWLSLSELLSRAWLTNAQRAQAWLKWQWLSECNEGLIALSGAHLGPVGQALVAGDPARAEARAKRLAELFASAFYIEVQRAGAAVYEAQLRAAVPLAAKLRLPVVATHPVQFLRPDDFEAHEARVCIAEGETLANPRRIKRFTREQWFKPAAQMTALFADIPSAIANTVAIAQRCNLQLTLGKPRLPEFPTPGGQAPERYFHDQSRAGLERRLASLYPDAGRRDRERPRYLERLEFEIATIIEMGFPGYFLIVADFIAWARNNSCPVGPGRGSGAGSLVAYSLGITDLDPFAYNLLFERFLNPERVSMPDFDIDFCQGNRDRVIDYVKAKYGRDAVSQIATFGTMAAKAALRDVGRVLGMGYGHVDSIAKLVPAPPGKSVTLARVPDRPDPGVIYARKEAPEIEQRERAEEEVAELLALAEKVEGMVRNVGMHAGGVLIAPGRITDFCPLYMQPGSDSAVSQFDKDDVEAIGLVKFDFLGLATLTVLELAKQLIVARHPARKDFAYETLPLDDRETYQLLSQGRTVAVFQFESPGMQRMLREARPNVFEDLIALVALYRPGPMELIPTFCRRKHGEEPVTYVHPMLRELLEETYGIMVYQEQVMQVAQRLGGYSLGSADLLRRAMGKKKAEEMSTHRAVFAAGAAKQGIDASKADEIFDLMEKFAGYGFNKSHAAAYALLAYHTAWLKVHHPAEFAAANMTVAIDDTDKLKVFFDDARSMGVAFLPPDVNASAYRFEPVADRGVRWGMGAIKGTGQGAIESVVAARDGSTNGASGARGGAFRSLFDFCARIDRQRVNKRVVEALAKAGAFDTIEPNRAALLASVSRAFDHADTREANADQGGLFDSDLADSVSASTREPELVHAAPWGVKERLGYEKATLGLYLSGHLIDEHEAEVRRIARTRISELDDKREPQLVAGVVADLRIVSGQRGRAAIFKLDDKSASIEAVASEELLNLYRELLRDDELLIVQGRVQQDRFHGGLRLAVGALWDLPGARCRFARHLRVEVNGSPPPVAELLRAFPPRRIATDGGERVQGLQVRLLLQRDSVEAALDLGDAARFFPSDEAIGRWRDSGHGARVDVVYDRQDA